MVRLASGSALASAVRSGRHSRCAETARIDYLRNFFLASKNASCHRIIERLRCQYHSLRRRSSLEYLPASTHFTSPDIDDHITALRQLVKFSALTISGLEYRSCMTIARCEELKARFRPMPVSASAPRSCGGEDGGSGLDEVRSLRPHQGGRPLTYAPSTSNTWTLPCCRTSSHSVANHSSRTSDRHVRWNHHPKHICARYSPACPGNYHSTIVAQQPRSVARNSPAEYSLPK